MRRTVPLAVAAEALGLSAARLRVLCAQRRVPGARRVRAGRLAAWIVPVGGDGRPKILPATNGRPRKRG